MPVHSVGRILLDSGKLAEHDIEEILRVMDARRVRFGEAAVQLRLVTREDVEAALAMQFEYPYLARGEGGYHADLVAAFDPFSPKVEALRVIRSQLMIGGLGDNGKRLAVVSPGPGEGRSFVAANLAVVFSQLGSRTLLVDADFRSSRQHHLFRLANSLGLSSFLAGRAELSDVVHRVPHFKDLSVIPAGAPPPNPQELLGRQLFSEALAELEADYDLILFDTPDGTFTADAQVVASHSQQVLMVTRRHATRLAGARVLSDRLTRTGVQILGAVLNTG